MKKTVITLLMSSFALETYNKPKEVTFLTYNNPFETLTKTITFKDIIGGVCEPIKDLKDFLLDKEYFDRAGAIMPKGYLLYGPPGCGKTMLVRALAGEINAHFIAKAGSEFVCKYIGQGAENVRAVFQEARNFLAYNKFLPEEQRKNTVIIFIDEFDAIGKRIDAEHGSDIERNQTINQFLVEMDGFNQRENIIVIAATNKPSMIDDALKRPGRLDFEIEIPLPTQYQKEEMLQYYCSEQFNRRTDKDIDFKAIVEKTMNFNCAEIALLANLAAIYIAKKKQTIITQEALEFGLAIILKKKNH